jgi:hypothetical protein
MNEDFPEVCEELMQEAEEKLREHVSFKLTFTRQCEHEAEREKRVDARSFTAIFMNRNFERAAAGGGFFEGRSFRGNSAT